MQSVWNMKMPRFAPLDGDLRTDTLIVGGGIAGLLCAYRLQELGADYALIEADRICGGVTKNTTAKLTVQHGALYQELIRRFGTEFAALYYNANQAALEEYRRLCAKIPCDFREEPAYLYARTDRRTLEREQRAMELLHAPATLTDRTPLPFETVGAVCLEGQAQFHPLKFLSAIVKDLRIYEETPLLELAPGQARTPHGTIRAKNIVIATHFPLLNKHGSYFLKLYQQRSYVLALENGPDYCGTYIDAAENGLSFRNAGDLLLLGGGGHRTGKRGGGWAELEQFAAQYYPKAHEAARWATQDCMSLDGVPYVGQYSKATPGLFVATGFNKWGMTASMAAAWLLADLVTGIENLYAPVFSPSRTLLRPQLVVNAFEATSNLLRFSKRRCPHLGCALRWNAQEHSWDCPCHGSRFAPDGRLLDNPATGDLPRT